MIVPPGASHPTGSPNLQSSSASRRSPTPGSGRRRRRFAGVDSDLGGMSHRPPCCCSSPLYVASH